MDKNEALLFSEISNYVARNPGIVLRTGLEQFILEVFYRLSPFSISDEEIEAILLKPWFQAQLADINIALWIGRSDRQIRLVDQVHHWPLVMRFPPAMAACSFCCLPEREPKIELCQEFIGTDRLIGSYVHKRCRKAMKTYRALMEDQHV